jgi:hypothetical protein
MSAFLDALDGSTPDRLAILAEREGLAVGLKHLAKHGRLSRVARVRVVNEIIRGVEGVAVNVDNEVVQKLSLRTGASARTAKALESASAATMRLSLSFVFILLFLSFVQVTCTWVLVFVFSTSAAALRWRNLLDAKRHSMR